MFRHPGVKRPDVHLIDETVGGEVEWQLLVISAVIDVVRHGPDDVVNGIIHLEACLACYTLGGGRFCCSTISHFFDLIVKPSHRLDVVIHPQPDVAGAGP